MAASSEDFDEDSEDDLPADSRFLRLRKEPSQMMKKQRQESMRASDEAHNVILASLLEEEKRNPLELIRYLSQHDVHIDEVRELSSAYTTLSKADCAKLTREQLVERLSTVLLVVNTLWAVRRRVGFNLPEGYAQREQDRMARRVIGRWRRFVEQKKEARRREELRAAKAAGKRKWGLRLNRTTGYQRRATTPTPAPAPPPTTIAASLLVTSDPSLTDGDPIVKSSENSSFVVVVAPPPTATATSISSALSSSSGATDSFVVVHTPATSSTPALSQPWRQTSASNTIPGQLEPPALSPARRRALSDPPSPGRHRVQDPSSAAEVETASTSDHSSTSEGRRRSSSNSDELVDAETEALVRKKVLRLINELSTTINRLLKVSMPKLTTANPATLMPAFVTLAAVHKKSEPIVLELLRACPVFDPPCSEFTAVTSFFAAFLLLATSVTHILATKAASAAAAAPTPPQAQSLYALLSAQRDLARATREVFASFEAGAQESKPARPARPPPSRPDPNLASSNGSTC